MAPTPTTPGLLYGVGRACARHPGAVIAVWIVILAATVGASRAAGGVYSDNVSLSGTQAYTAGQLLQAHDPAASGFAATVVMRAPGGLAAQSGPLGEAVSNLAHLPHVLRATDPLDTQPLGRRPAAAAPDRRAPARSGRPPRTRPPRPGGPPPNDRSVPLAGIPT